MQEQEAAAREKLKAAQSEVAKLQQEVAQMKTASYQAAKMMRDAEEALAGFDHLDNAIARYRSDALKSGHDPRVLTKALQNQINARAKAQDEIVQAADTAALLKDDLEAAEKNLIVQKDNLGLIASDILHVVANDLANELATVRIRYWELSSMLGGLSRLRVYHEGRGYVDVSGFTTAMGQLLQPYQPVYIGSAEPSAEMTKRWAALLNLLIADPDAELPELNPVRPEDYYKGGPLALDDPMMMRPLLTA